MATTATSSSLPVHTQSHGRITMLRPVALLLVAMTVAAPAAFAADPPSTAAAAPPGAQALSTDQFLMQLAAANTFEIDSSKLAVSKSKSETVKAFANEMISDHSKAAVKMKQAVTDAKAKAPREALDAKHQAIYDDLKKKEGA